jgi:hypothetical protein
VRRLEGLEEWQHLVEGLEEWQHIPEVLQKAFTAVPMDVQRQHNGTLAQTVASVWSIGSRHSRMTRCNLAHK